MDSPLSCVRNSTNVAKTGGNPETLSATDTSLQSVVKLTPARTYTKGEPDLGEAEKLGQKSLVYEGCIVITIMWVTMCAAVQKKGG